MKKILLFLLFFLSMSFAMEAQITTPSDYEVCDDNNDGVAIFDLTSKDAEILNGQNPGDYMITYHETLTNATQDISPVNTNYANVNQYTTTLYVRVENIALGTFAIVELNLIVNPLPTIIQPNDMIVYQNPYTGIAVFDLTSQNDYMTAGVAGSYVSFYLTQFDAMAGTAQLSTPSAYVNTSPTQTIWVRVTNAGTGCFVITDFDIMVWPESTSDAVYIPDANFKTALITLGYDTNADGEIQFSEALAVTTTLNVTSSNITDLTGLHAFTNITGFYCGYNNLASVDVSTIQFAGTNFSFRNNPNLSYINMKNGVIDECFILPLTGSDYTCFMFLDLPSLQFICIDEGEDANWLIPSNVQVNSYCSFVPGGSYNSIVGTTRFDENNNGCDANDFRPPLVKLNFTNGTTTQSIFTDAYQDYNYFAGAESLTVTPEIENPSYFAISPVSATVNFPSLSNIVETRNFCITPNGIHPDIEIAIAPIVPARPGFPAIYEVVYKNIGNQTLNQQYGISFFYNQNLMNFTLSNPAPETQNAGALNWSVNNLQPFESRSIYVTMNINAPTATNPVNIDDVLTLTANAIPATGETNTQNNIFQFNQTVVGSYDPNDKQCVEGDIVSPVKIGEYLHYLIRFENTGNYYAENIVVKDVIDTTKFDVSSLQIMSSSHPVEAKVRGNIAEFIFKNINLDSGGHGNILLKLKTKANLTAGTTVSNKADIFFDYNHPIITNFANTTFQELSVPEKNLNQAIKIYPNPTDDVVDIKADSTIRSIQVYDVQGRILISKILSEENASVDLSSYSSGIYYLKINSDNGAKTEKLIKK